MPQSYLFLPVRLMQLCQEAATMVTGSGCSFGSPGSSRDINSDICHLERNAKCEVQEIDIDADTSENDAHTRILDAWRLAGAQSMGFDQASECYVHVSRSTQTQ